MSAGEDTVARLRADLVQMEAERDAQAGQARRTVIDLQAVTAERDRLLAIVARLIDGGDLTDDYSPYEPDLEAGEWVELDSEQWSCPSALGRHPMDPADAELIRRAVGGDR